VNGNLTLAIVGDSFTEHYSNTYLEIIAKSLNISVIDHIGYPGGSQYKIYKTFLSQIEKSPDIILCVHTDSSRLYHDKLSINRVTVKHKLNTKSPIDKDIYLAADYYYKYLHNIELSKFTHNLIIREMQRICNIKNIKMINIPAFSNDYLDKDYGLWLLINPNGLATQAKKCKFHEVIKNHLDKENHELIAKNFIPHIKDYCIDNISRNILIDI
jgi:hypothetical protein